MEKVGKKWEADGGSLRYKEYKKGFTGAERRVMRSKVSNMQVICKCTPPGGCDLCRLLTVRMGSYPEWFLGCDRRKFGVHQL